MLLWAIRLVFPDPVIYCMYVLYSLYVCVVWGYGCLSVCCVCVHLCMYVCPMVRMYTCHWLCYCVHLFLYMCHSAELEKTKTSNLSVEKDHTLFAKMLHNAYCIDNNRECPNYVSCHVYMFMMSTSPWL